MGRYAFEHDLENAMDTFAVDTEFDDPESGWGYRAELLYAANDSATAWRSQLSVDDVDADY